MAPIRPTRPYDKYTDSPLADDGLYFAALAAQQLENCTEARTYPPTWSKKKYPEIGHFFDSFLGGYSFNYFRRAHDLHHFHCNEVGRDVNTTTADATGVPR